MDNLLNIFESYQELPNVPFQQRFTSQFVTDFLKSNKIEYKENKFTITVKRNSGRTNARKLVLLAHLDHPGIILRNKKEGVLLGLIGATNLHNTLLHSPIPLRVFDPNGINIGKAKLVNLENTPKQKVNIEADFEIPQNSYGMFDVPLFEEDKDTICVYNADDGIMVAVLLYLIKSIKESKFDLNFIFTKHEEVRQISSWHLAKHNMLGISTDDIIINLECLKTESVNPEKYGVVNYDKGPVLQLSNIGCLFGYKNPGKNLAETLLRETADNNVIPLQIGLVKDSCDSRPFTYFGLSPNICTLTIPNKYKHNGADDGKIRNEEISKEDIKNVAKLLMSVIQTNPDKLETSTTQSISEKIKQNDDITDYKLMKKRQLVNERIEISFRDIIRRGYYYPETAKDYLLDYMCKVISYLKYFQLKLK